MNGKPLWDIALHEMRTQRKLIRTHVFIAIALIICTLYFLAVSLTHMHTASVIPMLGIISPRYIMSLLSGSFVALFCVGVLILSIDLVSRDKTNRIQEVISSKPVRNIELLAGRLLGVMITMAVPMTCFLVAIVVYGIIAEVFSLTFGQPIERWSVVSFVLLDIVPNFAFFGSLVVLVAMLSKSRVVAISFAVFGLGTLFWLNSSLPLDISAPLQTVTGSVIFASELVPTLLTPTIVFNRISLLLMSIGFLYWSSSLYKRSNPTRLTELALGCTSFSLGLLVMGTVFGMYSLEHRQIDRWVMTHDDHFIPDAFPDVQKLRGHINIDPGRSISLNLQLDVEIEANKDSNFVLFSLNPGYEISTLTVAGETVTDAEFHQGLLKIPRRYFTSTSNVLQLIAQGRPDNRFAYLDSRELISDIVGPKIRQLRLLGTESSIFRSEFVVLLPGTKWYPTSGTATNEDTWEQRERDFFELDIEVSVPRRWLIAGPARREIVADDDLKTYRFQQSSPIPEFALVGSMFESASMEVEGIEFEVLYSNAHRNTFESFAPAEEIIRERLQRIIENVGDRGIEYPYGSLSLVEVPSTLRVFGGGVSMDTVMCPPGMLMIRESTLPTLPIKSQIDQFALEPSSQTEQDEVESQVATVFRYLANPMFESNMNYVFYRNLLVQQTSATHKGARALNTLLALFSQAIFPYTDADFDFQLALNRNILNLASVDPLHLLASQFRLRTFSEELELLRKKQSILNAPEIWDAVASFALLDTEQFANSTLNLRALKFRAQRFVLLLRDSLGTDNLAPILVDFTNRVRGRNFRFEELVSVFSDYGVSLEEIAGDMIAKAALPGFTVSSPTFAQQQESDPLVFESSFVLQNDTSVTGPVRLAISYQSEHGYVAPSNSVNLPPILVGANQSHRVVIESPNPVQHIWVKPYLSLNREQIRVDLPLYESLRPHELITSVEPVIRSIDVVEVKTLTDSAITIDDLDPEFSVVDTREKTALSSVLARFTRRMLGSAEVQLDNGLPVYQFSIRSRPTTWTRKSDPTAYGLYRRTFVIATGNDGRASVRFSAKLPKFGEWKLEYYLPEKFLVEEIHLGAMQSVSLMTSHSVNTINLEIQNGSTNVSHSLDAANLKSGWHTIGRFDLPHTDVDVLVSNKVNRFHESVFADAIRWTPVKAEE